MLCPQPLATLKIEELMQELKKKYTIVIVTHNMRQAARTSGWTGFFHLGELLEYGTTEDIFTRPQNPQTKIMSQEDMGSKIANCQMRIAELEIIAKKLC